MGGLVVTTNTYAGSIDGGQPHGHVTAKIAGEGGSRDGDRQGHKPSGAFSG